MASIIDKFSKVSLSEVSSAKLESVLTPEEKALASQFQTLAPRFASEPESLTAFNDSLRSKTVVAGNVPSSADLTVFAEVLPLAKKWSTAEQLAQFRHVLRWADLVQNTLVEVPASEQLQVNFEAELPREIKEKKKKEAAGTAGAAAPAKETKKEAGAAKTGGKG